MYSPPSYGPPPPAGPPAWWRALGWILLLPVGLILLFVFVYFSLGPRVWYPGTFLLLLLAVIVVMFAVRVIYRMSTRRYYRRGGGNGRYQAVRILRERYARGEITREQFQQMLQDLRRGY